MSKEEKKTKEVKIKITNAELVTQFHPAMMQLSSCKLSNLSALMNVTKVKKMVDEKAKRFFELRKKIAEQGCLKDKKGNPVLEGRNYTYESEEDKMKANQLVKELEQEQIKFTVTPLEITDIVNVDSITPQTVIGLGEYLKE